MLIRKTRIKGAKPEISPTRPFTTNTRSRQAKYKGRNNPSGCFYKSPRTRIVHAVEGPTISPSRETALFEDAIRSMVDYETITLGARSAIHISEGNRVAVGKVVSFDLQSYLSSRRSMIDRALDRHLNAQRSYSQSIWRAMRHGLFPGGKRIRPVLTLATGELFGARDTILLPFACAVEMVHAYSLIHDDLPALDNDDLRRGEPTTHKVFGEAVALLAGDGLLTEAFHLMTSPQVTRLLPADLILEIIHDVSHAAGVAGLVGGQALDIEAEGHIVDLATVEYIHVRKTGALILVSARMGAKVAGAKPSDLRRISRFSSS